MDVRDEPSLFCVRQICVGKLLAFLRLVNVCCLRMNAVFTKVG